MDWLWKINKAWVAAAVAFVSMTLMQFWGVEVSETVQASLVSMVLFVLTWMVPNKE